MCKFDCSCLLSFTLRGNNTSLISTSAPPRDYRGTGHPVTSSPKTLSVSFSPFDFSKSRRLSQDPRLLGKLSEFPPIDGIPPLRMNIALLSFPKGRSASTSPQSSRREISERCIFSSFYRDMHHPTKCIGGECTGNGYCLLGIWISF